MFLFCIFERKLFLNPGWELPSQPVAFTTPSVSLFTMFLFRCFVPLQFYVCVLVCFTSVLVRVRLINRAAPSSSHPPVCRKTCARGGKVPFAPNKNENMVAKVDSEDLSYPRSICVYAISCIPVRIQLDQIKHADMYIIIVACWFNLNLNFNALQGMVVKKRTLTQHFFSNHRDRETIGRH
jgi:hypothetical protein